MQAILADFWQFLSNNWSLSTFVGSLVFSLGLWTYITVKYVGVMLRVLRDTPPPLVPPRRWPVIEGGEVVEFSSLDGLHLRGTWVDPPLGVARRGCIVFCHEFGYDRQSVTLYAGPLLARGYEVFCFDFRNHGQSAVDPTYQPRQWCEQREVFDCEAAFQYVSATLEERGECGEFGVLGISRGACAAMLALPRCAQVRAVACDGLFSTDDLWEHYACRWAYIFAKGRVDYENYPRVMWRYLRWWLERVSPRALGCVYPSVRKALRSIRPWRPAFFVHGQRDTYVPVELACELHARAGQPSFSWIVAGAKHNLAVNVAGAEYHERLGAFFDRYLAELEGPIRLHAEGELQAVGGGVA